MKKIWLIIFCAITFNLQAQQFLNGSFEINHWQHCNTINLTNQVFDNLLDSVRGIGIQESLDLINDTCEIVPGVDGYFYSSLETSHDTTTSTAMSFLLSQPMIALDTYIVSFYDRSISNISQFPGEQYQIGYSDNDSTVGTIVYTSPLPDTIWTKRFAFITPLINAQYITAIGVTGSIGHFTILDNFSFDTTGLYLAIEQEHSLSFFIYPNPCKEELHIQLLGYVAKAREIKIYSVVGDVLLSEKFKEKLNCCEVILDMRRLSSGIYFVELTTEQGRVVKKIIKSE